MNIMKRAGNWFTRQISRKDDFKAVEGGQEPEKGSKTVAIATAGGAVVGAAAGGLLAHREISNNSEYFDYVSDSMPIAESGPPAAEVFGDDLARFQKLVADQSRSTSSGEESLQYLSFLKFHSPKTELSQIEGIYKSLEGQLGDDVKVRDALNMIGAHMEKYQTTPDEAHAEFSSYFGYESDFGNLSKTFVADQELGDEYLNYETIAMVKKNTSPIGHLGMTKAVGLGVAGGMAVGAVTGLGAGLAINFLQKAVAE